MAKQFKKAVVTYNGGLSYTFRGTVFKQSRPTTVSSEKLARALDGMKGFSVQMEFSEVPDEDEGKTAAKPVKKTKKTAKQGDS